MDYRTGAFREEGGVNDPLEQHADVAQRHFGFTDEERVAYLWMHRTLAGNPAALKRLIKHQRKVRKAVRMSPTIKTRNG